LGDDTPAFVTLVENYAKLIGKTGELGETYEWPVGKHQQFGGAHFHHFPTAQYLFVNFPFLRSGISPRLDPSRETEVWPCWSLAEAMICCHQIMNASWPMVRWWRCRKHREVKHHGFSLDFDHPGRTFPVKTA